MKRVLALFALSLSACTCGVPGVSNDTYACKTDADCNDDQQCISLRCRPKGTQACATLDCADPACDGKSCGPNGKTCGGGACTCSGNGGAQQSTETACADHSDNDCNGLTDCADSVCDTQQCSSGGTCSGGMCICPGAGDMPQAIETKCADGLDNDCDELTDCADPSCANQSCGANGRTCQADGGTCTCSGNGAPPETTEVTCNDGIDNDCNGKPDCADPACGTHICKANGYICMGVVCACTGNGGTPQPGGETSCTDGFDNDCNGAADCADPMCAGTSCGPGCNCAMGKKSETACTDGMDNDGDGVSDCMDSDCDGVACGVNGLACSTGACRCVVDGGMVQMMESNCADGLDNDCNGATDCQEAACMGMICGVGGKVCSANTCVCQGGGGPVEMPETSCSDGFDNDCNGQTDCDDPGCAGSSCGAGCTCNNGKTETDCSDGIDNDGDGQADCLDSDCAHKACSAGAPASVCCGSSCINLATDSNNCGGCGTACRGGACQAASSSGIPSGACICGGAKKCPTAPAQSCSGGTCACSTASECESGQQCSGGVCRYP
jgi:hypothetical protein